MRILVNPYDEPDHARAIVELLDSYARDPMGGGAPLGERVRRVLVDALRARPWIVTLLAIEGDRPVGLLVAVEGFSTFAAMPLLNIHDVAVHPEHRGRGVGTALLTAAEDLARARGCCKLTLEVLEGNARARALYARLGYRPYVLDPAQGTAQFWEKPLPR